MINPTGSSAALAWANHGNCVPTDSMTVYVEADSFARTAVKDFSDPDQMRQAASDSSAMKAKAETQLAAAMKTIPADAQGIKNMALNVGFLGTFAGAIDTAIYMATKQTPPTTVDGATNSTPEAHQQMNGLLTTLTTAATRIPEQVDKQGKGQITMLTNQMRSMLDNFVDIAAQYAGKTDDASRATYAQQVGQIFEAGYTIGASQTAVGGNTIN